MGVAVLIGHGGNGLQIPIMFFESMESGEKFLSELINHEVESLRSKKGSIFIRMDEEDSRDKYFIPTVGDKFPVEKVLTGYYSGCGGAYDFELREVPFGTPFINWDLD